MNDENPIEQFDLGQRLNDVAASANPRADLDAVLVEARRSRVRRRAAGGLAVAGLITVAGIGGYQLGHGRDRSSAAAPTDVSTVDTSSAAGMTTTVPLSVPESTVSDAPAATMPNSSTTIGPSSGDEKQSVEGSAGNGPTELYSTINPPNVKQVAQRTVDGMRVSLHVLDYGEDMYGGESSTGWKPPKWCNPQGAMQVRVAGPSWIDVLDTPWYSELRGGTRVVAGVAGANESGSAMIAVVQVSDPAVTAASITYDDGFTDSAAVDNGYVILVVPRVDASTGVVSFDGGNHPSVDIGRAAPFEFDRTCQPPPPELPSPGEQPADPAAAEAAVRDVAARVFDGKPDLGNEFDDITGLQDAVDKVQSGQYADAASKGSIDINGIVFTSPTEAWIRYDLRTGNGTFPSHFGQAVLIDGVWKLTRQTLCQELGLAGVQCIPSAGGSIQPPTGG